ncbi:hypothetical protein FPHOBKDP_00189 [Listeria phage LPJP1]|nr:hypothetical protein FPHOBKDP_00189 [Listeria phage LPJP1]
MKESLKFNVKEVRILSKIASNEYANEESRYESFLSKLETFNNFRSGFLYLYLKNLSESGLTKQESLNKAIDKYVK